MRRIIFGALVALWPFAAFAVDTSVPNLTAGGAVSDTDLFYCAQSAGTTDRKCTGAQVKTYAATSAVRATTTTAEALANSDQGKLVTFSNASAVACTIAQAGAGGNFAAGWAVSLKNLGAGTVTCTPTTSTVDGAATVTLTTGQGLDLYSDGANYFTQPGKSTSPGGSSGQIQYNNSGSFGGYTASGDAVVNTGTGVVTTGYKTAGFVASSWYVPQGGWTNLGTQSGTMTAATIVCVFGAVPNKLTIGALGAAVATLAAGGNFQLAIYSNVNSRPGSLIGNTGNISTAAVGTITGAMAANKQVGPGGADGSSDLWWCLNVDASAGGTAKFVSSVNVGAIIAAGALIGSTTAANVLNRLSSSLAGVSCSGGTCNGGSSVFGAWPASLAGSTWSDVTTTNFAIPTYQPASVP